MLIGCSTSQIWKNAKHASLLRWFRVASGGSHAIKPPPIARSRGVRSDSMSQSSQTPIGRGDRVAWSLRIFMISTPGRGMWLIWVGIGHILSHSVKWSFSGGATWWNATKIIFQNEKIVMRKISGNKHVVSGYCTENQSAIDLFKAEKPPTQCCHI